MSRLSAHVRRAASRRGTDEAGSVLVALIFIMVTSIVLTLVLGATMQEVSKTKHDRAFTGALPTADAGVQQALAAAVAGTIGSTGASGNGTTTQATGNATYSWTATPVPVAGGPTYYKVTSTTTVNRVTRTVSAEIYQTARFAYALFADRDIVFNGGNTASSYVTPGSGDLGTNGTIHLNGNGSSSANTCNVFNSNANGTAASRATGPCGTVKFWPNKRDIVSNAATKFVRDGLASCTEGVVAYTGQQLLPGRTYCFTSLPLTGNETITSTKNNPTVIFVQGDVSIPNHKSVHASPDPVDSGALQIYALGTNFSAGNHSAIGAAIWAPNATCSGGAQAEVYGSLVCGAIGNVGGWTFHYDTSLAQVGDAQWAIRHYAEN
jgi:hypothetical protein